MRHLAELTRLERLNLSTSDVGNNGLQQLKGLSGLTELILDYSFRFTDAGFAHLAGLNNLRHLGLLRTGVTDKSMKTVAGFTRLESLDLNYTGVSDQGLALLAGLE